MSRKSQNICLKLKQIAMRTFMEGSELSRDIEMIFLVFEIFMFISLITLNDIFQIKEKIQLSIPLIITVNIAALIAKYFCRFTFIRIAYICFLESSALNDGSENNGIKIFCHCLVFFNLLIDALCHIDFSFSSQNPYTETLNANKFLHNFGFFIIVYFELNKEVFLSERIAQWLPETVTLIILFILILFKKFSECKIENIKQILIRYYFLLVCNALFRLILFIVKKQQVYGLNYFFIVGFFSQILLTFIDKKLKKEEISIENEIKKGNMVSILFKILVNEFSSERDDFYSNFVNGLIKEQKMQQNEKNQEEQDNTLSNFKQFSQRKKKYFSNGHSPRVQSLEEEESIRTLEFISLIESLIQRNQQNQAKDKVYTALLEAQIFSTFNNKIFKAKLRLSQATTSSCSFMQKICCYQANSRNERKIYENQNVEEKRIFQQFIKNDQFRNLVLKTSSYYLSFWQKMAQADLQAEKVYTIGQKAARFSTKCDKCFMELGSSKTEKISMLYAQFCYMVEQSSEKANQIIRELQVFPSSFSEIDIDNKIYLTITPRKEKPESLEIVDIGGNVAKILGYPKNTLKGSNISILMPHFYGKDHEDMIKNKVMNGSDNVTSWRNVSILIKHAEGFYIDGSINLKLAQNNDQELTFQGYLEVQESPEYNVKNFFFINCAHHNILEIGSFLKKYIKLDQMTVHYSDFLNEYSAYKSDPFDERKKFYVDENGDQFQFFLLKRLDGIGQQGLYHYYVEINQKKQRSSEIYMTRKSIQQQQKTNIFSLKTVKAGNEKKFQEFFIEKQKNKEKLKSKKLFIVLMLAIMVLMMISTLQILLVQEVSIQYEQKQKIKGNLINIVNQQILINQICHRLQTFKFTLINPSLDMSREQEEDFNILSIMNRIIENSKYVEKYTIKEYQSQEGSSAIGSPKTLTQIVIMLVTNIYSVYSMRFDFQIYFQMVDNINKLIKILFNGAKDEYVLELQKQIELKESIQFKIQISSNVGIIGLTFVLFAAMMYINQKRRKIQKSVIEALLVLKSEETFSSNIQEFVESVTGEDGDTLGKNQKQDQIPPQLIKTGLMSSKEKHSFISQQNSNRDLFNSQLMTGRSEIGIQMDMSGKERKNIIEIQKQSVKTKVFLPRFDRSIFLFWTVCCLLLLGIPISYLVSDAFSTKIKFDESADKLIQMYLRFMKFQDASITHLQKMSTPSDPDLRAITLSNLHIFHQLSKQLISFEEIQMKEFKNFSKCMRDFEYESICAYSDCNEKYLNYSNLAYPALTHKMLFYIQKTQTSEDVMNGAFQFKAFVQTLKNLNTVIKKPIFAYLQESQKFQEREILRKYLFYGAEFLVIVIALIKIIWQYRSRTLRTLQTCNDLLNLVNKENFKGL